MAIKKLPIEIKPMITSECWTFYKMAIIQKCSFFDIWLASHFSIFTDETGNTFYGENGRIYPLNYYAEVLEIKEERIVDKSQEEIIDYIINEINMGNYIIVDMILGELHDTQRETIHETLFYGYDTDSKEFFVPLLINNVFQEMRVSFDAVSSSYEKVRNYYLNHEYKIYTRRKFFFGITLIRPKEKYINDNVCYEFICKLRLEYEGAIYSAIVNGDECHTYNTGLSCILMLASKIQENLHNTDRMIINKYKSSCLKICENTQMLLYSLRWFKCTYAKEANEIDILLNQYEKCYSQLYNCVLLFYKYAISSDTRILSQIVRILYEVYDMEKVILKNLISAAVKLYISYLKRLPEQYN